MTTATTSTPATPRRWPDGYLPRRIAFRELWEADGWRLKIYGIAHGRPEPRAELVRAAKRLAAATLPSASAPGVEPVGFVGVHDARGGCYVFVCWWADENELHHRLFLGRSPDALRPSRPEDSTACVWDLTVIDFERRAWYETMLVKLDGPDLEAYVGRRLETVL